VGGVLELSSSDTWRARAQIARVALNHRLSTLGSEPGFAAAGNLVQYGPNLSETCHRAAFYVNHNVKGAKPGGLPVEQPTRNIEVPGSMDGIALGKAIMARHPGLPVMLMTGYAERLGEAKLMRWEVLPKPCSAETLARAIVKALNGRRTTTDPKTAGAGTVVGGDPHLK